MEKGFNYKQGTSEVDEGVLKKGSRLNGCRMFLKTKRTGIRSMHPDASNQEMSVLFNVDRIRR